MQLAVSINLSTFLPSCFEKLGLALILQRTLTKWLTQPCIKATRMHGQHPAHRPYRKHQPVLGDERIPHRDSLAKYAVVGSTGQRNIFDLRCSERTHDGTNRSPGPVAPPRLMNGHWIAPAVPSLASWHSTRPCANWWPESCRANGRHSRSQIG